MMNTLFGKLKFCNSCAADGYQAYNDAPSVMIKTDPQRAVTHYNLGCTLQEQGKLSEAVHCYKDCVKLDPTHADAHYNLASALQELNILHDSEFYYKRSILLNSKHFMAFYNLGYLYQDMEKWDKSIECFEQAITIQPNDPDACINLGLALRHENRLTEAITAYQKAIAIDNKNVMAYVYQDSKNYTAAISNFETVIVIDCNHVDAWFNLAIAYQDRAATRILSAKGNNALTSIAETALKPIISDFQMAIKGYDKVCLSDLNAEPSMVADAKKAGAHIRRQLAKLTNKS